MNNKLKVVPPPMKKKSSYQEMYPLIDKLFAESITYISKKIQNENARKYFLKIAHLIHVELSYTKELNNVDHYSKIFSSLNRLKKELEYKRKLSDQIFNLFDNRKKHEEVAFEIATDVLNSINKRFISGNYG